MNSNDSNMFQYIELFSYFGGGILCVNIWPQIYKIYTTNSSKDLSYYTIILNIIGLLLMSIYAFLKNDMSLFISITISLLSSFILLVLKMRIEYT